MPTPKIFEVTACGFDGSTNKTDDRVFWVLAESREAGGRAISGTGAAVHGVIDIDLVDFCLPVEIDRLRTTLMAFNTGE